MRAVDGAETKMELVRSLFKVQIQPPREPSGKLRVASSPGGPESGGCVSLRRVPLAFLDLGESFNERDGVGAADELAAANL